MICNGELNLIQISQLLILFLQKISMSALPIMATVHKHVPTPMVATCAHVVLDICFSIPHAVVSVIV